jgi:hypothetical protein
VLPSTRRPSEKTAKAASVCAAVEKNTKPVLVREPAPVVSRWNFVGAPATPRSCKKEEMEPRIEESLAVEGSAVKKSWRA